MQSNSQRELREIQSVDERYRLDTGVAYMTGLQALVRLLLLQRQRDALAGLNTAGFVTGYRGSPLGGLDQELWRAREFLDRAPIHFQPGLNEELAATSLWGTQQINLFPDARYDGVFGLWYGKGPGVDRSGDAFKHANSAGTSRFGGVLAVAGDDHVCKSSTLPHQSEYAFIDSMFPILNPTNVQDIIDLGLMGYALSRFSGCWIALKVTEENADSSQTVHFRNNVEIRQPEFEFPEGGPHIRWPDSPIEQEHRLQTVKMNAALEFARANSLNRVTISSKKPRLGIVSTGKAYLDVLQALRDLGIDDGRAADIGIELFKVGMSWPLEKHVIREFASRVEEVLVVEEKRAVIESQLKEQLYHLKADSRPIVVGKFDENGNWLLPSAGELTPARVARALASRISRFYQSRDIQERLDFLSDKERFLGESESIGTRSPHFCSGCPHNTSTRVPEGSRAIGGIGCHFMVTWMDRNTATFTQMGAEGAAWIGQAPFTETQHVFQNLGDGTYAHSGLLAVRAAIAANVNITYKILCNDAVAMTGGQPAEGGFSVAQIAQQLMAEGVAGAVVVSDHPEGLDGSTFPPGVEIHHRRELDRLQRDLRERRGVTALIYDQTCAAELRRRRRRGTAEDPNRWVVINPLVCEGCGDCGAVSNCLSVVPLETEFGRKRAINLSSCNKDFSCLEGFCPSFVAVEGGALPRMEASDSPQTVPPLPEPERAGGSACNILLSGIGGTGVSTMGAVLGMAAHLEGRAVMALDQTGLAQKFGAVLSHVRISDAGTDIHSAAIPAGEADLLIGADLMVAAGRDSLIRLSVDRTTAILNTHEQMPPGFVSDPDYEYSAATMISTIAQTSRGDAPITVDASRVATALLGDSIATNLFLLGIASQRGLLPVGPDAIERTLELNGVAVDMNKQAFLWGRYAAVNPDAVESAAGSVGATEIPARDLDTMLERRSDFLTDYQSASYARRYLEGVNRVRDAEQKIRPGETELTRTVGHNYFKLLAYKDEYEVARLFVETEFLEDMRARFGSSGRLKFFLSPPLFARLDPDTGRPRKYEFGGWIVPVFRLLSRLRFLRGTLLDPFGYSKERREERRLIADYEDLLSRIVEELSDSRHELAVELAGRPDSIRGFGPVKRAAMQSASAMQAALEEAWEATGPK